ncbi:MAG: transposase [Eubacterium sp.]|nr:transposase [Eubacterium sp.]
MKELPKRKPTRLKDFNYSSNNIYFITICAKDMKSVFGKIVGFGVLDEPKSDNALVVPKIHFSKYGRIINKQIIEMDNFYDNINIYKFVVMPNHMHLLIEIKNNGASKTPHPTNSTVSSFIGTLKRFTNKKCDTNLWQRGFYDHIIRDEEDYITKAQYIENNPAKWLEDKYYTTR